MAKSRSVFEDVGGDARAGRAKAPAPGAADALKRRNRRQVAYWLIALAALVAIMVLVGGLTRLTDSGLAITEWAPVVGAMPPLSPADWDAAFAAYQTTDEFRNQNAAMTLAEFKPLFWWEWGHRQFGRLIGLVWFAGFVFFLATRRIPTGWTGRLFFVGLLGGAQGAVGWWMVASGLSGRLDVAPYRLATHLGLAFLIFAVLIWFALMLLREDWALLQARRRREKGVMALSGALAGVLFLQILLGALVAGLDAGRGHIDWPLMGGNWFPEEAWDLAPAWVNAFENPALAQFNHRILGYALAVLALVYVARTRRSTAPGVRFWGLAAGAVIVGQMVYGIITVMHAAPLEIAIVHQALALVCMAVVVRAKFEAAYPVEAKIAR